MSDLLKDKSFNRAWTIALGTGLVAALGATGWDFAPWKPETVFGVLVVGCGVAGFVERPFLRERVSAGLAWLVGGVAYLVVLVFVLETNDRVNALHLLGAVFVAALPYLLARSTLEGGRPVAIIGAIAFVVSVGAATATHLDQRRAARERTEFVLEVRKTGEVWARGAPVDDVAAALAGLPPSTRVMVRGAGLSGAKARERVDEILANARLLGLKVSLDD